MAWSFVGVSTAVVGTTTTLTLTEPAGVADGDLLIACIASRTTATTPVTNTGWTAIGSRNNNNVLAASSSGIASGTMLFQVRAGTPDLTFVIPAGISVAMGQIVAYRGHDSIPATLVPTANALGTATSGATYATVRSSTNATTTPGVTAAAIGQGLVSGTYSCAQYFLTLNTSAVPAGQTTAVLSVEISAIGSGSDVWEVREVSSTANMIAGDSLAALPLLGSRALPTAQGRTFIPLDITSMSRTTTTRLLIHSQGQGTATAPASSTAGAGISSLAAVAELQPIMLFIDAAAAAQTSPGVSSVSVAGLTTRSADDLIVAMAAGGRANTWSAFTNATTPLTASGVTNTSTAPSTTAWIERADLSTGTGADTGLGIFDAVRTETGATGNLTVTASLAAGHVVIAGAFKIAAAGGGISVPVTGVSATGSVGSVTVATVASVSVPVTGVQATGAVGTATAIGRTPVSVAVSGVQASGAVDAVTIVGKANVSTTGVAASGSVGTVTVTAAAGVSVPVTGVQATGAVGTVTVSTVTRVDVAAPVTGVEATGSIGSVSVTGKASTAVTGIQATGAVGTVTVVAGTGVTVPVTGVAAAGSVDSVSIVGKANVPVTGVQATGAAGGVSVTAGGSISVIATGVEATGSVGAVEVITEEGLVSVWNGSAWVDKPAKVWDGAVWAQKPVKHWDGSAWV